MQLLLTPIPLESGFMADAEVREMVERGSAGVRSQAVEAFFLSRCSRVTRREGYFSAPRTARARSRGIQVPVPRSGYGRRVCGDVHGAL